MQEIKNENGYATSDLYLSAFLKAKGLKLIDQYSDRGKMYFVFKESEKRKKLLQDFYNNGMVSANNFKNALQDLKTILFNH